MAKKPIETEENPTPEAVAEKPSEKPAEEVKRGRQTAQPECPYHHVPCKSNRSDPYFTRYYCPVDGCAFSQKVARPNLSRRMERLEEQEGFSAR